MNAVGKALSGARITPEEALDLLEHADLTTLGALADLARRRLHPDGVVTYIIDRNVNYTNVCNAFCTFCAFYRPPHHEEGYVLSLEQLQEKIAETYALGGNQILLQGGHNPALKIEWYEDTFRRLKEAFPDLWLHALSAPEIVHIRKVWNGYSVRTVIRSRAVLARPRRPPTITASPIGGFSPGLAKL